MPASLGFRPDSPRRTESAAQSLAIFTPITQLDSGPVAGNTGRSYVSPRISARGSGGGVAPEALTLRAIP
jgi:hypothetical protein